MILRVYNDAGHSPYAYAAWLEPEPGDERIGMCVGVGRSREEAEKRAKDSLKYVISHPPDVDIPEPALFRCALEPDRYECLSKEHSELYETVRFSTSPKDMVIKELLEHIAERTRSEHANSKT